MLPCLHGLFSRLAQITERKCVGRLEIPTAPLRATRFWRFGLREHNCNYMPTRRVRQAAVGVASRRFVREKSEGAEDWPEDWPEDLTKSWTSDWTMDWRAWRAWLASARRRP